jgi:SAM-dependent methyltransferase
MPDHANQDPEAARFDAFEAAGWERAAAAYEPLIGQVTRQVVDPLLDAVEVTAGDRLLDLATGPGYVAGRAAERGASVTGLDLSQAMLEVAGRNHPTVDFRRGDMQELPFEADSFDAVVGNFAILHVGQPDRVSTEAARVLRPGGRFGLTVWDDPARSRGFAVVLDALAEVGATTPAEIPPGPPFFKFADDTEFTRLLEAGGFVDIEISTLSITQRVTSPEAWWDALVDGSVRTAALIRGQTDEVRTALKAAFDRNFEALRSDDGYELPMAVKLASGRRAS